MKIVCETGTLADAIGRAARVAPSKGAAYEKACGLLVEFDGTKVIVMATDMEVTYRQTLTPTEAEDQTFCWRLPSAVLAGFVGGLPMNDGSVVTMQQMPDGRVKVSCGNTIATFNTIELGGYPVPKPFPATGLSAVEGFARRVQQVAFATDRKSDGVFSGVYVTGSKLYGFDRQRLAMVDCTVPISKPVAVPLAPLAGVLRNTADLQVGIIDTRLVIEPDADTQASTIIFAESYPDVERLLTAYSALPGRCTFSIEAMQSALGRMMVLCRDQRYPRVTMTFHPDTGSGAAHILLEMNVPELGEMRDHFPCSIDGLTKPVAYAFTPNYITEGLGACAGPNIVMEIGEDPLKPCIFDDGDGFRYLFMPRDPKKDVA